MKIKNIAAIGAAMAIALSVNAAAEDNSIVVNGQTVDGVSYIDNETVYLPVRSVSEALGFEVEWNGENKSIVISNLPQYVKMTVGKDEYTFARTAPFSIGAAPIIIDDTAYVPTSVFTDVLSYNIEDADGIISISEEASVIHNVKISEITDEGILVNDTEIGDVLLVAGDDTVITDISGRELDLSDIGINDVLTVEYGDAMASSLPPVNNPKSIVVSKPQNDSALEASAQADSEE